MSPKAPQAWAKLCSKRLVKMTSRLPYHALTLFLVAVLMVLFSQASLAQALSLGKLKGDVWGSGNRNLVVILHGDGGPGRYDGYAKGLAAAAKGTTVVTLVRPGFSGRAGRSPGNNASKDHYTSGNNKKLAEALAAMKNSLRPGRVIVMGHSGGAGQLGTVIAAYPGIVDVAILAACPCDVPRWRIHRRGRNNWRMSQSPHKFAAKIPRSTKVIAITNERDSNTRPRFAKTYVEIAQKAGANVTFQVPKGGSHSWSDYQPHVHAAIRKHLR